MKPDGFTGLTALLSEQAAALNYDSLAPQAVELVRQCVLDYVAVAIAGSTDPLAIILLQEAIEAGEAEASAVIGHRTRLSPASAALVNGAMAHALDYDDVNLSMPGHPTAVVLAALLGLAEANKLSGRELVAAFVAGYETACRVGMAVQPGHYAHGFHSTGTVGCFGAAAGAGRLLGLQPDKMRQALGVAGSQAAGLKAQFGSMCKPFHAGRAAQSGLLAAKLALRGFTSHPDLLECEQGFCRTFSTDFHPEAALAEPADGLHLFSNLFKFHASGYFTHAPIECVRRIRDEHSVKTDQVAGITIRLGQVVERVCNLSDPQTGNDCKFSVKHVTAMALAGMDTASVDIYNLATARDPLLAKLRNMTSCEFSPDRTATLAEVELRLHDGRRLSASHDSGLPATDIAGQGKRLEAKFHALVAPILGPERSRKLAHCISDLQALPDVGELMRLATPG
ncbi:MAG: MmgE/PrpD family protein [Burkholderiaceae bacterium]|nr:MmgE/PrpD family protein [Burkholderiaceae bacterium]